jgi:two-component system response regulator DesR
VLLAEEFGMFRTALVTLLSKEGIEVVADVKRDPKVVVALASRLRPDVAVVAADEEDTAGLATIRALREGQAEHQVVALTVGRSAGLVDRLLSAGVSGVIDKNAQAFRLLRAIRVAAAGGAEFAEDLVASPASSRATPFTRRERDVLRMAAEGASGPEIANVLSLSPGTVRNYLSSVMTKTGARSRIDAIRIAKGAGWF